MIFFSVSFLFIFCIYLLRKDFSLIWRLILVILLILFFIFLMWLFKVDTRSASIWFNNSPYKQLIALFFILLGMSAKVIFNGIEERKKKISNGIKNPPVKIDKWDFFKPFIVSFIVFGVFWNKYGHEILTLNYLIISFQNGFFWQTILEKHE